MTYLERAHERLINRHHSTGIVKLPTIVGSRKQSDQLSFREKFITVLDNLQIKQLITSVKANSVIHGDQSTLPISSAFSAAV